VLGRNRFLGPESPALGMTVRYEEFLGWPEYPPPEHRARLCFTGWGHSEAARTSLSIGARNPGSVLI
jgi:hypothetical protein